MRIDEKYENEVLDSKEIELCGTKYIVELKLVRGNGDGVFPKAFVKKPLEERNIILDNVITKLKYVLRGN